jgi:hypothetical protein
VASFTSRLLYPREPTGMEAEWAPQQVWMRWRAKRIILCPCLESNPGRPAHSLDTSKRFQRQDKRQQLHCVSTHYPTSFWLNSYQRDSLPLRSPVVMCSKSIWASSGRKERKEGGGVPLRSRTTHFNRILNERETEKGFFPYSILTVLTLPTKVIP